MSREPAMFSNAYRARWRWILPLAAFAAVVWGLPYVIRAFDPCETVVHRSVPSPDGSKSIVVFGRKCGATVGFNTQVSIAPTGSSFSADNYPAFFVVSGLQVVMAKWLGEHAIEIAMIPGTDKVFKREQHVGNVEIRYP